ncbi:MAG: class D sortase [Ruminococcus sp.]|nr:class D sortase [Ruminococcus sp.]
MKKSSKKIDKTVRRFVIVPIVMCVAMCLLTVAVFYPTIAYLVPVGNMFLSDKQVDYSKAYDNIFVPTDNDSDTVDASEIDFPSINKQFGEIKIEGRDVYSKLFFGDGSVPLRNGVGVYAGSFIPGYGKTILIAGHNNTYFNGLKNVKKGDVVEINTSYGNYKYKITKTKIYNANSKESYDLKADKENLILYTCYPFDQLGLTEKRFFVYAKKISGPQIVGLYE